MEIEDEEGKYEEKSDGYLTHEEKKRNIIEWLKKKIYSTNGIYSTNKFNNRLTKASLQRLKPSYNPQDNTGGANVQPEDFDIVSDDGYTPMFLLTHGKFPEYNDIENDPGDPTTKRKIDIPINFLFTVPKNCIIVDYTQEYCVLNVKYELFEKVIPYLITYIFPEMINNSISFNPRHTDIDSVLTDFIEQPNIKTMIETYKVTRWEKTDKISKKTGEPIWKKYIVRDIDRKTSILYTHLYQFILNDFYRHIKIYKEGDPYFNLVLSLEGDIEETELDKNSFDEYPDVFKELFINYSKSNANKILDLITKVEDTIEDDPYYDIIEKIMPTLREIIESIERKEKDEREGMKLFTKTLFNKLILKYSYYNEPVFTHLRIKLFTDYISYIIEKFADSPKFDIKKLNNPVQTPEFDIKYQSETPDGTIKIRDYPYIHKIMLHNAILELKNTLSGLDKNDKIIKLSKIKISNGMFFSEFIKKIMENDSIRYEDKAYYSPKVRGKYCFFTHSCREAPNVHNWPDAIKRKKIRHYQISVRNLGKKNISHFLNVPISDRLPRTKRAPLNALDEDALQAQRDEQSQEYKDALARRKRQKQLANTGQLPQPGIFDRFGRVLFGDEGSQSGGTRKHMKKRKHNKTYRRHVQNKKRTTKRQTRKRQTRKRQTTKRQTTKRQTRKKV